jgi:hypothetical protein
VPAPVVVPLLVLAPVLAKRAEAELVSAETNRDRQQELRDATGGAPGTSRRLYHPDRGSARDVPAPPQELVDYLA